MSKPFAFSGRKAIYAFICALFAFSIIAMAFASRHAQASLQGQAKSPDGIWQYVEESSLVAKGERQIIPQVYRIAQLGEDAFKQLLGKAPLEFTQEAKDNPVTITLPMPDSSFATFRVEESPVMEAALAAQYPEIKTYRGQGIDDPAATIRFDFTPAGFHAIILSERGTIYIDPYSKNDTTNYIVYYKSDYQNDAKPFRCYFTDDGKAPQSANEPVPHVANGTVLRTYRLALAATGEYTTFQGGTVPAALAAMTTTMNRVNGVYEHELAVRMVLVANENLIIYTNATTDPYTNNDGFTMLTQNQANLDLIIGTLNYDIGHVFSTGGGGVAGLGVVCSTGNKARGVTGNPGPVGDGFDIDYVAHEMGHQFGGRHTFNGTLSNCGGGNRSGSAAYEPGSGTTIMAYAGICGTQNVQLHSNDYFHVKSLEEIASFIGGTSCDVETSTGNTLPTVTVGSSVTIPKGTPFSLAATASDANGDALSYCWEEYDLGPASPPDTDADGSARPIFRSFNPTSNASRTFPKISDLLNNTSTFGEALPSINRTMNFQVTVRDNRAGGGGITTATVQVAVNSTAGPFLVTQPNTNVTWNGGTPQTVTWNVAGTSAAPVNTANVKISLSTDGGNTFPVVLAASTPNDGSETITAPNLSTNMARVKVEAVGNIYFDISNANFVITSAVSGTETLGVYFPTDRTFYLRNTNTPGNADLTIQYGPNSVTPIVGDWNGDGITTIGVYEPATRTFYLRNSNTPGNADIQIQYGPSGVIPVAGDWNGDGTTTIGVYDPSTQTFYLRNSNTQGNADIQIQYGPGGSMPVVGDWNADGVTTIGVYETSTRTFYLRNSNTQGNADITIQYGPSGAEPAVGDFDGNQTTTIGVYDPTARTFYLRNSNTPGNADITIQYGPASAIPLIGDWDGL